jgi:outer membrane protein assembly factor BamB
MKPAAPLFALLALTLSAQAFDWPQWRGARRDDRSPETGLLKEWPADGPKRLWIYDKAGKGYSGPSIVNGRLFTLGAREQDEMLICLDAATGEEKWASPIGGMFDTKMTQTFGMGPRCTPTVDGDRVYALGSSGILVCAQTSDGKVLWKRTMAELGGKPPTWGYAESPLIDGDKMVCTPGGPQGALAALDKKTGATLWQSKDFTDDEHYSSIVPAVINGQPQYVQRTVKSVVGISPKDGAVLWKQEYPGKTAVIPTPIVEGNQVYVTAGYGIGSMSFIVEPGNTLNMLFDETSSTGKVMKNHHGGVILLNGYIYGNSDGLGWTCQDWKTGLAVWNEKSKLGKGAISYADGHFYLLDERSGVVALIDASADGWHETGRFTLDPQATNRNPSGLIWTHPVICNGRLYLRDQNYIYCYAVK